jgi:hypothetical protein
MSCNTCAPCSPTDQTCVTVYPVLSPCLCNDTPAIREEGPAGGAATISVGSTTTSSPGGDASVVNIGTSSAAILDFTIPQGATGPMPSFSDPVHITNTLEVDGLTTASGGISTTTVTTSGDVTVGGNFIPSTGITGVTDGSAASSGKVGELVSATTLNIALSTGVAGNITSISLPAGCWDVVADFQFTTGGSTTLSYVAGTVTPTSMGGTFLGQSFVIAYGGVVPALGEILESTPMLRVNISLPTTYYAVAQSGFGVSTNNASAILQARRVR